MLKDHQQYMIIVVLMIITIVSITFQQSYSETDNEEDKVLSPKKQIKMGISPFDIQCKEDMRLVFKYGDKSPACFKISSLSYIISLGWGDGDWDRTKEYLYQIEPDLSRTITLEISDKTENGQLGIIQGIQQIARPVMTITEKIVHPEPIEVIEIWRLSNKIINVTDIEGNDIKNRESELNSGYLRDSGKLIYGTCPDDEKKLDPILASIITNTKISNPIPISLNIKLIN